MLVMAVVFMGSLTCLLHEYLLDNGSVENCSAAAAAAVRYHPQLSFITLYHFPW